MHSLDHIVSERLRTPNAWELSQYSHAFGDSRQDWTRVLDEAPGFAHDEAVLRVTDQEARRRDMGLWCMPVPALSVFAPRASVFRSIFLKDIGGVAGDSDVWWDGSFTVADGVSGKLQSWVDYIDNTHLCTQPIAANQADLPYLSSFFNRAYAVRYATGTDQLYVSNRPPSQWAYIGSGAGSTTFVTLMNQTSAATSRVICGTSPAVQVHGLFCFIFGTTGLAGIQKQGDPTPYIPQTNFGDLGFEVGKYVMLREGSNLQATYEIKVSGASLLTAAYGNTPSVAPANGTFHLGANPGPTAVWRGDIRAVHTFRRILNSAELLIWQQYTQSVTGVLP